MHITFKTERKIQEFSHEEYAYCHCCKKTFETDLIKNRNVFKSKEKVVKINADEVIYDILTPAKFFDKNAGQPVFQKLREKVFCSENCAEFATYADFSMVEKEQLNKSLRFAVKEYKELENEKEEIENDREHEITITKINRNGKVAMALVTVSGVIATAIFASPILLEIVKIIVK